MGLLVGVLIGLAGAYLTARFRAENARGLAGKILDGAKGDEGGPKRHNANNWKAEAQNSAAPSLGWSSQDCFTHKYPFG